MKIKFLSVLGLLFCFSIPTIAQYNADSLWAIWSDETQPVVTRLEALNVINTDETGFSRGTTNPDTAFHYAVLMYDLAQIHGLKKWMGEALRDKGNYYYKKGLFKESIDYYNQSKIIAEEIEDKELIAGTSLNLGLVYMKEGKADQGITALSKALEIFKVLGDKKKQATSIDRLGVIYNFMKSDSRKALECLKQSLELREELIKTDDNEKDRFIINGIKQSIKSVTASLEEITDTINLDTYALKDSENGVAQKKDSKVLVVQQQDTIEQDKNDAMLEHFHNNIKKSKELGNKLEMAEDLSKIGAIYFAEKNELDSSLNYHLQAFKLYEELGNKNGMGTSLGNIGKVYYSKGNIDESLQYLNRGSKILQQVQNQSAHISIDNIIASIYAAQKEYAEAIAIYSEIIQFYNKSGNRRNEAGSLANMGSVYRRQGDNDTALEYLNESLKISQEINFLYGEAGANLEIGEIYFDEGDYELALKSKTKSLIISEKIGYIEGIQMAQGGIASILAAQGKHSKSILFGNKALVYAQKSGNIAQIRNSSKVLAASYKETGRYQKALEMNEIYHQMQDSLQSKENQKAVIQQQVRSNYEKQKTIDDLENEKLLAIETQKKEDQQKLSFAIGLGLLFISLLALVIFNKLKLTRQQKAVIQEQKKKVEQSEKYKEQFLANMSHEIRTPMHAISGMVNILKRNNHLPEQTIFLDAMQTSSDNLVVILNDVLDLSKIEAGKLDIESIPFSPKAVIENVTQILKYKAEEKGLQLNYQIEDDVPSMIMGDPTRLNQILTNLTSNAIKFTEKGSIDILLQKENERLQFRIKDTGIGISKDKLETIFDAFEQGNNSTSRHYGGTGLGLSISKQLVEMQNGKIWAKSNPGNHGEGNGTTFQIDLPLIVSSSNAQSETLVTQTQLLSMASSLKGIRILIAEDNPFNQMIAQDDLNYLIQNAKIDIVENGALAVEQFKTESYDLILMDVQMPEMNGFEATKKIRAIEKTRGKGSAIPIIAMTASLLKSEVQNCYDAGMDNYIPKPYKTEELIGPIHAELNPN